MSKHSYEESMWQFTKIMICSYHQAASVEEAIPCDQVQQVPGNLQSQRATDGTMEQPTSNTSTRL